MRIIAGQWKGLKLEGGKNVEVRPLTDRIKESVFGILGDSVNSANILDLFAGSGSFGIEALSRGAAHITFCEKIPAVANQIKKNLIKTKCEEDKYQIVVSDVFRVFKYLLDRNLIFDIIFVDPPFRDQINQNFLASLSEFNLLKRKGILIYRHHKKEIVEDVVGVFETYRSKQYGDSIVKFYRKIKADENSNIPGNV
jgi:16S rRNA (guanine966-N2)-methyltransferase